LSHVQETMAFFLSWPSKGMTLSFRLDYLSIVWLGKLRLKAQRGIFLTFKKINRWTRVGFWKERRTESSIRTIV
jgi:hypothetical protein